MITTKENTDLMTLRIPICFPSLAFLRRLPYQSKVLGAENPEQRIGVRYPHTLSLHTAMPEIRYLWHQASCTRARRKHTLQRILCQSPAAMISLKLFVTIYLIGGFTFLPLVALVAFHIHKQLNLLDTASEEHDTRRTGSSLDPDFKAAEIEEAKGVNVLRQGWVSVTTRYYYFHTEIASTNSEGSSDASEIPERSQLKKKHKFYANIKHGNLFLYRDNSPKSNLIHAISLQDSFVTLWPRHSKKELPDSALFTKRTCISILRKGATFLKDGKIEFTPNESVEDDAPTANQFFLYFENNIEKEDWYFDLINVSKSDLKASNRTHGVIDPNVSARAAHLITADMLYLIQTINSTEGQLTTKWINALLGRIFLSLQRTETLKRFFHEKLYQKLTKIKRPDFLDDFVVEEVQVGTSAPMITNPRLVDLSLEGLTKIAVDFQYKGDLGVIVSTKATINLGSRFKQREVALKLSLKLKELSGPLIVLMKPPPSNRIWYTFQTEPIFDMEVEPVVSSSKLSFNMVTNAIKSKFAEALKESLVAPYWDDIVYYSTEDEIYRGGIWEKYDKSKPTDSKPALSTPEVVHKQNTASFSEAEKGSLPEERKEPSARTVPEFSIKQPDDNDNDSQPENSSLKRRTSQKIENFRNILKTKSRDDYEDEQSNNEVFSQSSPNQADGEDSEDSQSSKKYFKNSIKKIGKWYKETLNNTDGLENENKPEADNNFKTISNSNSPEMISNRRTSLPKRPRPSNIPMAYQVTTEGQFSPQPLNSTEMFVNKDKNAPRSSTSIDPATGSFPGTNRTIVQNQAFVKAKGHPDLTEDLLQKELETPVRSATTLEVTRIVKSNSISSATRHSLQHNQPSGLNSESNLPGDADSPN